MLDLELQVSGATRARSRMLALAAQATDMTATFRGPVADAIMDAERQTFRQGAGWPALKASTIRRKRRRAKLRDTDRLYRSLTVRGAPGQRLDASADELVLGTTVFYARFNARRRPFMKVGRIGRRQIERAVRDALMGRA
jgi:phage gpG-like protein